MDVKACRQTLCGAEWGEKKRRWLTTLREDKESGGVLAAQQVKLQPCPHNTALRLDT